MASNIQSKKIKNSSENIPSKQLCLHYTPGTILKMYQINESLQKQDSLCTHLCMCAFQIAVNTNLSAPPLPKPDEAFIHQQFLFFHNIFFLYYFEQFIIMA